MTRNSIFCRYFSIIQREKSSSVLVSGGGEEDGGVWAAKALFLPKIQVRESS